MLIGIGDQDMDMDASSTLSCSALTSYGAVKNTNLKPNDNAVIVGAGGGLGLINYWCKNNCDRLE
jgi:propanol-preferring alcohol dehydrogenase